ncbi:MAG TPA: DUF2520 domain-containing protein [Prolixibacteraceae bacterium]|nr:DUF2520 domain-containing protein [Prolixibacteraceae bacterium]
MDKKIAIVGAGNLATRVSLELHLNGVEIIQVYSRTVTSALTLARMLGCNYVTNPEKITPDADIYLISVSDLAFSGLLEKVNFNNKLLAHTAGSIPMSELAKYSQNYGVFYPLQTFSKYRDVNFSRIPFCIEGNTPENEQDLMELARVLSKDVRVITSEQRKQLHLAAVFASNFVNHMYSIASELVAEKGLPFDILNPLISETASKVKSMTPRAAQTGPAMRKDQNIIQEHLNMLSGKPRMKKLYSSISDHIFEYHKLPRQTN